MPIQRLRRALTSSSTNSTTSNASATSSTTTSSRTSNVSSRTSLSSFPTTHDLPLLSRSPNTPNTSPRDVFPDAPFHISPALLAATPTPTQTRPAAPTKRHSRTKTLLSAFSFRKKEVEHPAVQHLKPADPKYVAVLEAWGGFGCVRENGSVCGEVSPMASRRNSFDY